MANRYLVSVGKDIAPDALKALMAAYGDIGAINLELFAVRGPASTDDVMATIKAAVKITGPHILVAEVSDCSFRGPGEVSHAAGLLRNAI